MSSDAPAGWYAVDGGQRYWDGRQWTEHFQPAEQQALAQAPAPQAATTTPARHPQADAPDTIWSAVGRPMSGIGAGKYRLTDRYLYFERGTLRTNAQQVPVEEIHDVDAAQSMTQKARGVGTITLTVVRTSGTEVVRLEDIGEFREGVAALNQAAHKRREEIQTRANTQNVNYAGTPIHASPTHAAPGAAPSAPPSTSSDVDETLNQLERLGKLRDAGVLTEEEFQSKKASLLNRL